MTDDFSGTIEYSKELIRITPDDLTYLDDDNLYLSPLTFRQELINSASEHNQQHQIVRFTGQEDSLLNYLDLLEVAQNENTIYRDLRTKLILKKFFKSIQLSVNTKIFTGAQIKSIQNYINDNLQESLRIIDLARIIGINQQYFKVNFKNTFNTSVYEYIKTKRLNTALQLIQETDEPLSSIALQVGYSSISSFSQAFKNHFGNSPTQYKISKN